MKKTMLVLVVVMFFFSCADSKTFTIDGKEVEVQPYGWVDYQEMKNDKIIYKACIGNAVWSVVTIQSIFIPIILTGYYLFEPVKIKE